MLCKIWGFHGCDYEVEVVCTLHVAGSGRWRALVISDIPHDKWREPADNDERARNEPAFMRIETVLYICERGKATALFTVPDSLVTRRVRHKHWSDAVSASSVGALRMQPSEKWRFHRIRLSSQISHSWRSLSQVIPCSISPARLGPCINITTFMTRTRQNGPTDGILAGGAE
jgi:hypothetical protein